MSLAIMAGLQGAQMLLGASQQQEHYRQLSASLKSERQALEEMKPATELLRQANLGVQTEEFGTGMEQFGSQVNQQFQDIRGGFDELAGQSGLAFSSINKGRREARSQTQERFDTGYSSAFNQYEKGKMQVNVEADTALANIDAQMKSLTQQIGYAEGRADDYFSNLF